MLVCAGIMRSICVDFSVELSKTLSFLLSCAVLGRLFYKALGILYSSCLFIRIGDNKKMQESITKAAAIVENDTDKEVLKE